jgi:singapore isolate B (sub-type 7) whole genome shotgun sequence assembly, scaffold_1
MRFENVESGVHYDVPLDKIDKGVMNKSIREYITGVKAGDFSPCGNSFFCDRCEFRNVCKHREF